MPSQTATILCGALVAACVLAIAVVGTATGDEAPPPNAPAVSPADAELLPRVDPSAGDVAAPAIVVADPDRASAGTRAWTTGVVKGDIQLAVSVLDRLRSIHVEIVESRNRTPGGPPPFRRTIGPLTTGHGTPTFEIRDIPFSTYPYVVSVVAPGLNGSRRTLAIDERCPLVDDVLLSITPPAPLTILLRDQDAQPWHGVAVRALPIGEPPGRDAHEGTSDNFGSVVLRDVQAGEYEVTCSVAGQPLQPPTTVSVQPGVTAAYTSVRGQGHTITIERGVPVTLLVSDGAGYPMVGLRVVATATDRIKLTTRETTTDQVGRAGFAHLTPGLWSIAIHSDLHEPWERQRTLQPNQDPVHFEVRLLPRRL